MFAADNVTAGIVSAVLKNLKYVINYLRFYALQYQVSNGSASRFIN